MSSRPKWRDLICNDLCQPPKVDNQAKTNYSVSRKHPDRVMISDPGIGHSDIRGFGLLLTDRSMVRRERHSLVTWITVSCANSDPFVDRSNLDKTITLSRCFPWLISVNQSGSIRLCCISCHHSPDKAGQFPRYRNFCHIGSFIPCKY